MGQKSLRQTLCGDYVVWFSPDKTKCVAALRQSDRKKINGIELTHEEAALFLRDGEQAHISKLMRVAMSKGKSISQLLEDAPAEYRFALFSKSLQDFRQWESTYYGSAEERLPAASFISDGDPIPTKN